MTVHRPSHSQFFQFDFILNGQRYRGSTGETSKTKAREVEAAKRREIKEAGGKGKLARLPLGQAIDDMLDQFIAKGAKAETLNNHTYRLSLLRERFGADTYLDQLSQKAVDDWVRDMMHQPRPRKAKVKPVKGVRKTSHAPPRRSDSKRPRLTGVSSIFVRSSIVLAAAIRFRRSRSSSSPRPQRASGRRCSAARKRSGSWMRV